ncbi:MAG: FG-GAP-like repeat-containing protein [Planctomycetaceae bacterium]
MQPIGAFRFVDQSGQPFESSRLQGRVWLASFAPLGPSDDAHALATRLARLERQFQVWPDGDRISLVSFPPDSGGTGAGDLAERLSQLGVQPDGAWRILSGDEPLRQRILFDEFRLVRPSSPTAEITKLALVDPQGRVRGFYSGLAEDSFRVMLAQLRAVLNEPVEGTPHPVHLSHPDDLFYAPWMEDREAAQREATRTLDLRHDFTFEDRLPESGITFVNRAVADSTRDWKLNHYDHANGVAVADVDGDGRLDLYLPRQVGGNQLWRNLGGGRFEDITDQAGVALQGRVSVSASFADLDNDGDADLFVTTTRHGNALFLNDGTGRFADVTREAGLESNTHSSSAEFFDYDRDGKLDLFVVNVGRFTEDEVGYSGNREQQEFPYFIGMKEAFAAHLYPERTERSRLYHNLGGGRFQDVSDELQLDHASWSGDATPLDLNRDGWIDLYVLSMQGNDEYWINREGKRFERYSTKLFPVLPWGSMGVKAFDWNHDGLIDLYTTNMHADMWEDKPYGVGEKEKASPKAMPESYLRSRLPGKNVFGNAFFQSVEGGLAQEVSEQINSENYWPWGLSVGDLNADGWPDAFITSCMNLQWRYHPNSLLLNDQGRRFVDAEFVLGVEPRRGRRIAAPWYELNCDGVDRDHPDCEGHQGRVVVWGALGSRGSVMFDLDDDGDLDIVTNDFNSEPMVLVSNLRQTHPQVAWLQVLLRGTQSNRDGLGARVEVQAGGQTQVQVHDGQSGYLSQSRMPLYFGLDGTAQVERIVVQWPSGQRQELPGPLPVNQTLTIAEPESSSPGDSKSGN